MRLTFEIRLASDYHIAAGYGAGEALDSVLHRDADGQPVIRGSAVVGLLRDGMRQLLQTAPALQAHLAAHAAQEQAEQDKGVPGAAARAFCPGEAPGCPLCRILGTPARPKPWVFSSARPVGAMLPVRELRRGSSQPVTRVQVDPLLRRARDGHLFVQEEGSRGLVFRFSAECADDGPEARRDASLLVAAARMVRRLGSARRRGRGACLWTLVAAEPAGIWMDEGPDSDLPRPEPSVQEFWLELFERYWLDGERPPAQDPPEPSPLAAKTETDPALVRLRVILRVDEPVVIAERPSAGNLFTALDAIPGTTLWGALAARVARGRTFDQRRKSGEALVDAEDYRRFVTLFSRGGLRLTPLYPAETFAYGSALWPRFPAPLDLLTCKHFPGFDGRRDDPARHGARGCATADTIDEECRVCRGPLEPARGLLTLQRLGGLTTTGPGVQEEMHPRIDPTSQRVNTGDLFGYQALAVGQFFVGELTCRDVATWAWLRELADLDAQRVETMRLGKAIRRGYGSVSLWLEPLNPTEPTFAAGLSLERRLPASQDPAGPIELTLTLVSDALLLDPWGRAIGSLAHAGLDDAIADGLPVEVKVKRAFCRTGLLDGFAGHLGLPRWRDRVIRAGSALGLTVSPEPGAPASWLDALHQRLAELEHTGIGLRREEGLGRLVFNHPVYRNYQDGDPRSIDIPPALQPRDVAETPEAIGQRLIARWERRLDVELADPDVSRHFRGGRAENWQAAARWLNAWADLGVASTLEHLEALGRDDLLRRRWSLQHGASDDGAKEVPRKDWFCRDGGRGMERLEQLLVEWRRFPEAEALDAGAVEALEPSLIRALASRLDAMADSEVELEP